MAILDEDEASLTIREMDVQSFYWILLYVMIGGKLKTMERIWQWPQRKEIPPAQINVLLFLDKKT